jgi:hypothetical protein
VELVPVSQVIRHYGSWEMAKEAPRLSGASSARAIDARFRRRRLGKIWHYTEEMLRKTLAACVAHYGYVPQVAEFAWWRVASLSLPGGYAPDHVAERLERG